MNPNQFAVFFIEISEHPARTRKLSKAIPRSHVRAFPGLWAHTTDSITNVCGLRTWIMARAVERVTENLFVSGWKYEQMLIYTPRSATGCTALQACPIWYFSCLAREEMLHKSCSLVLVRWADRQTELDRCKYPELHWPGPAVTEWRFPLRNKPPGFCWVIRLGSGGSQTLTESWFCPPGSGDEETAPS